MMCSMAEQDSPTPDTHRLQFTLEPMPSRFVSSLAKSPLLVVVVTFIIAAAITGYLMVLARGMDAVTTVGTLAAIWGLDLALVIYLLTARDTDKLLAHINALQDQLSAVLEAPGTDAEVIEAQPDSTDTTEPTTIAEPITVVEPPAPSAEPEPITAPEPQAPTEPPQDYQPPQPHQPPGEFVPPPTQPNLPQTSADAEAQLTQRIPSSYLAALQRQTGVRTADIRRAWTPNPSGAGPWVVESDDGQRWSIFQTRGGRPTVIPLGTRNQARDKREDRRLRTQQLSAVRTAIKAERLAQHHNPHDPHPR